MLFEMNKICYIKWKNSAFFSLRFNLMKQSENVYWKLCGMQTLVIAIVKTELGMMIRCNEHII